MNDDPAPGTVLVRGTATADVPPDYATIRIHVRDRARTREKALDSVAKRATAVDRILDELGDVVSNRVTTAVRTTGLRRGGRGDGGYEASRSLACDVSDASVLGGLFEQLVESESDFEGPWWRLDDTNPVFDDVRARAAADARARALAYAGGVGCEVGGVRWLSETGLRVARRPGDDATTPGPPIAPAAVAPGARLFGRGGDDEEPVLDVVVQDITVSASIEAAFDLAERPSGGAG